MYTRTVGAGVWLGHFTYSAKLHTPWDPPLTVGGAGHRSHAHPFQPALLIATFWRKANHQPPHDVISPAGIQQQFELLLAASVSCACTVLAGLLGNPGCWTAGW